MKKQNNNFKTWFEDNKDDIKKKAIRAGYLVGGAGFGYLFGKKLNDFRWLTFIAHMNAKEYIKFFDPSTGLEIAAENLVEVYEKTK